MARQPLGPAAKSVIKSIRLTKRENEVLTAKYGSPGKAIRGFVDSVMRQHEHEYAQLLKRDAK